MTLAVMGLLAVLAFLFVAAPVLRRRPAAREPDPSPKSIVSEDVIETDMQLGLLRRDVKESSAAEGSPGTTRTEGTDKHA